MATERKRLVLLSALIVVLAVVLYRVMSPPAPETAAAAASDGVAARTSGQEAAPGSGAPEVHLQSLEEDRPKPLDTPRNPFGFAMPPPPPVRPPGPLVSAPPPSVPAGPPPPPAIPLKFIGIFEAGPRRIANLMDPTGHLFAGAEGDVIAGQYRILKVGVESIDMAYLDGRGRQTIRLGG